MDPTARASVQATRTAEVWRQLAGVTDPEMDESITDLGFVATVDIHANDVTVEFRLPTYWCAANFAFMMAEDIRDQVSDLAWVDRVNVRLVDHYSSAAINDGMAKAASFTETFASEATDDLSELRRIFRRKAFMTRQEKLLGCLRRSGWTSAALLGLTVRDLGDAVDLGADGEQLRSRYLDIRAELGLPCEAGERAITTVDGEPVSLEGFEQLPERAAQMPRDDGRQRALLSRPAGGALRPGSERVTARRRARHRARRRLVRSSSAVEARPGGFPLTGSRPASRRSDE